MTPKVPDRRRVARFAIQVPVEIVDFGPASSLDLSATGISFTAAFAPERGEEIHFRLRMDAWTVLECYGRVVRVEDRGPQLVSAATIDEMMFRPARDH